jgi:hypothetical protein
LIGVVSVGLWGAELGCDGLMVMARGMHFRRLDRNRFFVEGKSHPANKLSALAHESELSQSFRHELKFL